MAVVIDTDVISYVFKKDTRAAIYEPHLLQTPKFISFMSLAELRRWQFQRGWGERKNSHFDAMLSEFGVIYADEDLCSTWAHVTIESSEKGRPISASDAWVAATALMFDVPLVTHNKGHFEQLDDLVLL